jgi:DNA-binding ferritin-like protein
VCWYSREIPESSCSVGLFNPGSAALLAGHEAIIRTLRIDQEAVAEKYGDIGTNDLLIGLMERHEKMAWMLRAFLEGRPT